MADDLLATEGFPIQVSHVVSVGETATFSAEAVTLTDLDTGDSISGGTATSTAYTGPDAQSGDYNVLFQWTPSDPADIGYLLTATVAPASGGSRSVQFRGHILVWPVYSVLDRYLDRIKTWVQETEIGETQQSLSQRDYRDALRTAADAYSLDSPQVLAADVSLTTGTTDYPLPTGWRNQVSRFRSLEYPAASNTFLLGWQYLVDEQAGTLRLTGISPQTGQTLRVRYEAPYALSHTVDSLPAGDFEAICLYAAGVAMAGPRANLAARTEAPEIAAGLVSYRDQQQRCRQQGMDMMAQARLLWAKKPEAAPYQRSTAPFGFGRACGRRGR